MPGAVMSEQHSKENPDQETVVQSRRRLLKAAAATAPLIATLPNGAAWATASTAQCIITSRTGAANVVSDPPPDGDTFVRQKGREVVVGKEDETDTSKWKTVYTIKPDDTSYYDSDGKKYNLPGSWEEKASTDKQLLRFFDATSPDDVVNNPTGVENCGDTPIPPQCIFPVDQVGSGGNNQPLATSCLCSVNPTLVTAACGVLPPT
jgi:hypothetical protein